MEIKLSQKERMLLEDDKNQEEICVTKYKNYAQQTSDPELKQLFDTLASEEQHHYDMVDQMLQGKQPDMSHAQWGQSRSSQWEQGQSGQSDKKKSRQSDQSGYKGITDTSDKVLCSDLLATEKYVSGTYDTGIFEAANPTVRQALQHIQHEEQSHGEQLFNYMNSHGMYNVK